MNAKKFDKKLALNKKTIADLNNKEMKKVFGGLNYTPGCTWGDFECNSMNPCNSWLPYYCKGG